MSALPETVPPEAIDDSAVGNLPPGTELGAYELVRVVGRGGMGAVYEAMHRAVNKRVAVKTLLPHLAANKSSTQRFLREAEAAARVRHPHTVDVTDVGVANGIPFIVMEYLEGENLSQRIDREAPLAVENVVDLILPVCSALVTAHDEGVVHRDLKPENIFIARTRAGSEVVKVLDFGISYIAQAPDEVRLTQTNSVIGTPRYMSPEQTKGARYADARSDQYAVGVILYQCLTNELPFDGESFLEIVEKLATKKIVPPSKLVRGISGELEAVVLRVLSKDASKRFATMRELALALLPYASSRGRAVWEPAFAEGASPPRDANVLQIRSETTVVVSTAARASRRALAATIGLAALAALLFGVWLLGGSSDAPAGAPSETLTAEPATPPRESVHEPSVPSGDPPLEAAAPPLEPAAPALEAAAPPLGIDAPAVAGVETTLDPTSVAPTRTVEAPPPRRPARPPREAAAASPRVTRPRESDEPTARPGAPTRVGPNGAAILR